MHPYVAELVGTAILLLLGSGVVCNVLLRGTKGHGSGWIVIAAGWGVGVFAAVAVSGRFSGAHINPAVTVGLAVAGRFPWSEVLPYVGMQVLGAYVGSGLALAAYWQHFAATEDRGAKLATFSTSPAIRGAAANATTEAIGTLMLVFGILLFASPAVAIGGEAAEVGLGSLGAIPAGLLVFAIGLSLGGPTGYAINPARDFGPRLAHATLPVPGKGGSDWGYAWAPVLGPLIGAASAGGLAVWLVG